MAMGGTTSSCIPGRLARGSDLAHSRRPRATQLQYHHSGDKPPAHVHARSGLSAGNCLAKRRVQSAGASEPVSGSKAEWRRAEVATTLRTLKIVGNQPGALPNFRRHFWADFIVVVKSKDVVRPSLAHQRSMRAGLPFDPPANAEQGRKHATRFQRRPMTHARTANRSASAVGTSSPFSTRSAITRKANA